MVVSVSRKALFSLLALIAVNSLAQAPDSIIGVWHFDAVRTMTEALERRAEKEPERFTREMVDAQRVSIASLPTQAVPEVTLTISETTISTKNRSMSATSYPYRVIGGNARLVIVEVTDEQGFQTITNVHLLEDGIAIGSTDCWQMPEQCARERRRALAQFKKQAGSGTRTATIVDSEGDVSIVSGDDNAVIHGTTAPEYQQPRLVYFKPAN